MPPSRARYFPVEDKPLEMAASLFRFGTDFGQGEFDRQYFQVDDQQAEFLLAKRTAPTSRRFVTGADEVAVAARAEALAWMRATLSEEHPGLLARIEQDHDALDPFDAIARNVQEDFAVLQAGPDDLGRTLVVDVRFPSGWRPERLQEADFSAIHQPVPGFPPNEKQSRGMVRAMVDRGPYVRFVWTVGADPALDQHPDTIDRRVRWESAEQAYFRVERQVTVPLPKTRSSVFLIRTHVRPVTQLDVDQRARLLRALEAMPEAVRAYKNLPSAARIASLLAGSEAPPPF